MYSAIILCAGSGKRTGLGYNKMFYQLQGETVYEKTVNVFFNMIRDVKKSLSYVKKKKQSHFKKLLNKKCMKFVEGGKERQDSVYEGLKHVTSDYVMIHDGARPFVKKDLLDRLVVGMEEHKAVLAMVPCKDTIKRVKDGRVVETLIRSELMQAQTPQAFDTVLIRNAYKEAIENNIQATDDASMLELQGKDVYVVEGDYDNIKITTKEDLK